MSQILVQFSPYYVEWKFKMEGLLKQNVKCYYTLHNDDIKTSLNVFVIFEWYWIFYNPCILVCYKRLLVNNCRWFHGRLLSLNYNVLPYLRLQIIFFLIFKCHKYKYFVWLVLNVSVKRQLGEYSFSGCLKWRNKINVVY